MPQVIITSSFPLKVDHSLQSAKNLAQFAFRIVLIQHPLPSEKIMRTIIHSILFLVFFSTSALAAPIENYLYTSSGELEKLQPLLERADISGVQVVYSWKQLETAPGVYDFSAIEGDLARVNKINKKLFVQLQDRFFSPQARNIPSYLQQDPQYHGGLVAQVDNPGEGKAAAQGWVAMQWDPALRARYQALITALAASFDGKIAGINLPETSIDINQKKAPGFSCDNYFAATLENMLFARNAFKQSSVVQYTNFWPCEWDNDHRYMSRLFETAAQNHIGLGGPDVVPNKKAQMKNSYPFFNRYKGKLSLVAMAVQEPTLTYTNPQTKKKFTRQDFSQFAADYLGADIIFWSAKTPWLHQ